MLFLIILKPRRSRSCACKCERGHEHDFTISALTFCFENNFTTFDAVILFKISTFAFLDALLLFLMLKQALGLGRVVYVEERGLRISKSSGKFWDGKFDEYMIKVNH